MTLRIFLKSLPKLACAAVATPFVGKAKQMTIAAADPAFTEIFETRYATVFIRGGEIYQIHCKPEIWD